MTEGTHGLPGHLALLESTRDERARGGCHCLAPCPLGRRGHEDEPLPSTTALESITFPSSSLSQTPQEVLCPLHSPLSSGLGLSATFSSPGGGGTIPYLFSLILAPLLLTVPSITFNHPLCFLTVAVTAPQIKGLMLTSRDNHQPHWQQGTSNQQNSLPYRRARNTPRETCGRPTSSPSPRAS